MEWIFFGLIQVLFFLFLLVTPWYKPTSQYIAYSLRHSVIATTAKAFVMKEDLEMSYALAIPASMVPYVYTKRIHVALELGMMMLVALVLAPAHSNTYGPICSQTCSCNNGITGSDRASSAVSCT